MTLERMAGTMPVHAPIYPEPPFYYRNLELLAWTYETDEEAALDVLPDCLELSLPATATLAVLDAPICTLGSYQEAFISIAATFEGEPVAVRRQQPADERRGDRGRDGRSGACRRSSATSSCRRTTRA